MGSLPPAAIDQATIVPWTIRDIAGAVLAAILWVLFLSGLSALAAYSGYGLDPAGLIVLGTLMLLAPVWYFVRRKYRAPWSILGLRPFAWPAVGLGCGLMLLSLLFNVVYAAGLAAYGLQIQPDITPLFAESGLPVLILVGGAIIAPIVEEIFFRGFVFGGLRQRWGWPVAALGSSLLFALAHVVPTSFLPILILGLIFSALYQLSGSIWPAILMHMLTNTVALLAAYALWQGWVPTP
jgi:membrane protease YdiL (CAAX protease family)